MVFEVFSVTAIISSDCEGMLSFLLLSWSLTMKVSKILYIAGCISLFLFSAVSVKAENCLEAREWYEEGLSLADNSEQEVSYYQQAILLCREFVAAHNRLGEVYKNQKKYALSIQAFKQARIQALSSTRFATRTDSRDLFLESAVSLGEIYRIQGNYERAAEELTKALELVPDSRSAKNNLQYVYKRLHRYDDVLPSSNNLLVNAVFSKIPGLGRPAQTYAFDLLWKHWKQESTPVTLDMLDMDELVILPGNQHSTITIADLVEQGFQTSVAPDDVSTTINISALSMRYGLTNNITLGLVPRVVSQSLDVKLSGFDELEIPTYTELGDTELLFKYRLWGRRKQHVSFYTILNIPTGKEIRVTGKEPLTTRIAVQQDDGTEGIETFEFDFVRYVPFGSESYDVTPGVAFTMGFDQFVFHSNIQYKFTDGILIGDEFRFNLAGIYNMNPSVNATMELNYRWRGDARRRFHTIIFLFQPDTLGPDTIGPDAIAADPILAGPVAVESFYTEEGGSTLFLSPGLQFSVTDDVRIEAGVQVPVINDTSGWSENIIYQLGVTFNSF